MLKKLKGIICQQPKFFFHRKKRIIRLRALQIKMEKAVNHFTFFSNEKNHGKSLPHNND